ncbi:LPO_1073/Vpar_1526 family protein [Streptomyces sp. NPDC056663]|uniref:LPO_1073/Vpar_1526 family protein n=1 Tax=Streptomyces sp. NPDC056663 TaxID=3345899 RepID=UPI0036CB09A6
MRQAQRSGDNSTNIQGEVVNLGLSYRDAREIAKDVYEENITKFTDIARNVASERAQEFTDKLLSALPMEALETLKDPDVQRSLFHAQQEYACSGEKDLGDLLIHLLSDKMKGPKGGIKALALSEALKTAPKVTSSHISALSVLMLITQTKLGVESIEAFQESMKQILAPIAEDLHVSNSDLAYLEYAGCLSISAFDNAVGNMFATTYPGLFTNGFMPENIAEPSRATVMPITIPCLRDPANVQLPIMTKGELKELAGQSVFQGHAQEITRLIDVGLMSGEQIEQEVSGIHPTLADFAKKYNGSRLKNCQLTAIGTTLAHTNLKRVLGEHFDTELDIWVN